MAQLRAKEGLSWVTGSTGERVQAERPKTPRAVRLKAWPKWKTSLVNRSARLNPKASGGPKEGNGAGSSTQLPQTDSLVLQVA